MTSSKRRRHRRPSLCSSSTAGLYMFLWILMSRGGRHVVLGQLPAEVDCQVCGSLLAPPSGDEKCIDLIITSAIEWYSYMYLRLWRAAFHWTMERQTQYKSGSRPTGHVTQMEPVGSVNTSLCRHRRGRRSDLRIFSSAKPPDRPRKVFYSPEIMKTFYSRELDSKIYCIHTNIRARQQFRKYNNSTLIGASNPTNQVGERPPNSSFLFLP